MDDSENANYPTEFLNSLEMTGMPPHTLALKVGCPVIVLRSLDAPRVVNGTRCVVSQLMRNVLECRIAAGPYTGDVIAIPRIPVTSADRRMPFTLRRLQFPLSLCFAMTINKSQGQTLKSVGLYLETPVFSHGQLYVGMSRIGRPDQLTVQCRDSTTQNVVYTEVLN